MSDLSALAASLGAKITRKRVKNINFRISRGEIAISVPLGCSNERLRAAVAAKAQWLAQTAKAQQEQLSAQSERELQRQLEGKMLLWGQEISLDAAQQAARRARVRAARWLLEASRVRQTQPLSTAALCDDSAREAAEEAAAGEAAAAAAEAAVEEAAVNDVASEAQNIAQSAVASAFERDCAKLAFKLLNAPYAPAQAGCEAIYQAEIEAIVWAFARFWALRLGARVAKIEHSKARSRWGVCYARSGLLRFSQMLATRSLAAANYVALHECAHLFEANHGPKFWAIVAAQLGDYSRARGLLRG